MKADLHFHPSFFSRGDKPHITELRTPSLDEIEQKAFDSDIDVLAITSCSWPKHIDKRWNEYLKEAEAKSPTYREILSDQAILSTREDSRKMVYIIHGQELQTNKGDINVLFADQRVPIEKTSGKLEEVISAARDSGNNVLIGINQVRKCKLSPQELKELHQYGEIDFLESYNSLDINLNNGYAKKTSKKTEIPGIAVSDGHRLSDMGRAYIQTNSLIPILSYKGLARFMKEKINSKKFKNVEESSSLSSRFLYAARLANAVLCPRL